MQLTGISFDTTDWATLEETEQCCVKTELQDGRKRIEEENQVRWRPHGESNPGYRRERAVS